MLARMESARSASSAFRRSTSARVAGSSSSSAGSAGSVKSSAAPLSSGEAAGPDPDPPAWAVALPGATPACGAAPEAMLASLAARPPRGSSAGVEGPSPASSSADSASQFIGLLRSYESSTWRIDSC